MAHYNLGIAWRSRDDAAAAHKELDELNGLQKFRARLAGEALDSLGRGRNQEKPTRRCRELFSAGHRAEPRGDIYEFMVAALFKEIAHRVR